MLRPLTATLMALALAATAPGLAAAATIDERHPGYQAYTQGLADADRALLVAIRSIEGAKAAYSIPGVDLDKMVTQMREIEQTLRLVITPEQKRMEFQTLVPDGVYFTTPYSSSK